MMSRSSILFSLSASRHRRSARTVKGFSQMPPIIMSRPASMRLAMAISPSRDNSSTEPISRRYMRTGSSVRSVGSLVSDLATGLGLLGLDDVDTHLVHNGEHVLDLLGGDLLGRHHGIELLIGDVAALLSLLDHLLDGGVGQIEQRQRTILLRGLRAVLFRGLGVFRRGRFGLGRGGLGGHAALACHALSLHGTFRVPLPYGEGITWGGRPTPGLGASHWAEASNPLLLGRKLLPTAKKGGCPRVYPWTPPESRPNLSELR